MSNSARGVLLTLGGFVLYISSSAASAERMGLCFIAGLIGCWLIIYACTGE